MHTNLIRDIIHLLEKRKENHRITDRHLALKNVPVSPNSKPYMTFPQKIDSFQMLDKRKNEMN